MSKSSEELRDILQVIKDEGAEVGNIDVVMNVGSVYEPAPVGGSGNESPIDPPVDNRIMHTIKPRSNGSFPVYRTPDINANKVSKLKLTMVPGQQVEEREPPKKIHNSHVWSDREIELPNLLRTWAWLPRQAMVQGANGKYVLVPYFYVEREGWPIWQGCFIERKYLSGKEQ